MGYSVPVAVQQTAKRALALRRQYGRGGTDVGLGTAQRLARGGAVSLEFVKKVSEYFPRHAGDRLDDPTSNGSIAWGLWGGDAGRRWSEGVMAKAKTAKNPKVVISQLVKRIASAGKFDGSEFKGKQVDPRVVEKQWKRQAVIHGVAEYGAPVQKLLRDEYESAFWQGAARGLASMANPKPKVTDRALRYRANANPPKGPKQCLWCNSKKNVEVGHLDGHEENNKPENLHWTCRSCNTALGAAFKKLGIGRRTRQYNPAGAATLGQWLNAVQSAKGDSGGTMDLDAAIEMIRYTSPVKRSEFAREIWAKRRQEYGPTGRRNPNAPDIKTSAAIKRALAKLTEEQRYEVVRHSDRMFHAMLDEGFDSKKAAELAEVAALNKAHALSLVRRNPEEPAAELYEKFHGKPSERVDVIEEEVHYHEHLAGLGQLISLKIKTPTRVRAELSFADADRRKGEPVGPDSPLLCCSEDGRQLYIVGGNQEIDLSQIDMDGKEWRRDSMNLGEILVITYRTQKGFHNFEDIDYFHHFSESSGNPRPVLLYDTRNKSLSISGGSYQVKDVGIVD